MFARSSPTRRPGLTHLSMATGIQLVTDDRLVKAHKKSRCREARAAAG